MPAFRHAQSRLSLSLLRAQVVARASRAELGADVVQLPGHLILGILGRRLHGLGLGLIRLRLGRNVLARAAGLAALRASLEHVGELSPERKTRMIRAEKVETVSCDESALTRSCTRLRYR